MVSLSLTALAPPHSNGLAVLLELGDEGITLLDDIGILLVLVIRAIGLDDSVDTIDRARYPVTGDELGKISVIAVS